MNSRVENLVNRHVTYTLECEGKFYIVQSVPARVNEETGSTDCCYDNSKCTTIGRCSSKQFWNGLKN